MLDVSARKPVQSVPAKATAGRPGADPKLLSKVRVLVVDDQREIADTLSHILVLAGYDARPVYSAEMALIVACDWIPQLAIVDVELTDLTGVDFAVLLKQKYPRCEVLVFSGQASTPLTLLKAQEEGYFFSFLAKPVKPAELLMYAARLLEFASAA